jgi:hypothetical protein
MILGVSALKMLVPINRAHFQHRASLLVRRQADNKMKLWHSGDMILRCDDLQVEKAVASLALECPSQSLVSGMASITLVNYPPPEWLISR